jgi:hypothetical protein
LWIQLKEMLLVLSLEEYSFTGTDTSPKAMVADPIARAVMVAVQFAGLLGPGYT